jgi:hypothetical protein
MEELANWSSLSESERQKIYAERRHHKTVAVFLHELAHTLGAPHRAAHDTIMNRVYDPRVRAYDDATLSILRLTLPSHLARAPFRDHEALRAILQKDDGGWIVPDRDAMLAALQPTPRTEAALPPPSAAPATLALPPQTPEPLSTLKNDDRSRYDAALSSEKGGDSRAAWSSALPLFEAYPRVLEVQGLRCRLAGARGFFQGVVDAHCERFVALGGKR